MTDSDNIFLIDSNNELERIPNRPYDSEDLLQSLLDDHPELLVGDQINPDEPPRWMVISREAGIPDGDGASDRWSIDHFLLDQFGRPTFVEVKRSSDTRIRREVVGQMLDYAANALAYWPSDRIRIMAADTFGGAEQLDAHLVEFLEMSAEEDWELRIESYWKTVEKNLREGELRLLFVADEIPTQLKRIIEFLNERMQSVEVLGVEIRQYEGQSIRALVPRVVGQTEYARQQKTGSMSSRKGSVSRDEFLASCPGAASKFFEKLFEEAERQNLIISWGSKGFSLRAKSPSGRLISYLYGYPPAGDGKPNAIFQGYLEYIDPGLREETEELFKNRIPFERRGNWSLNLELDDNNATDAIPYLEELLIGVKMLSSREA